MKIHGNKKTNKILEDNGTWLLIDISTPKYPDATMACDTADFEAHTDGRICAYIPSRNGNKYIYAMYRRTGQTKTAQFHQDVLPLRPPLEVDHIQHGTRSYIDNRRANLRAVTHAQNLHNQSKQRNNTSGTPGVRLRKASQKWQAYIYVNSKHTHLGHFADKADAIAARKAAEREYYGEYAFTANNGATK